MIVVCPMCEPFDHGDRPIRWRVCRRHEKQLEPKRSACTTCGEHRPIFTIVGDCTPCSFKNRDLRFHSALDRSLELFYRDEYGDEVGFEAFVDLGGES